MKVLLLLFIYLSTSNANPLNRPKRNSDLQHCPEFLKPYSTHKLNPSDIWIHTHGLWELEEGNVISFFI